MLNYENDIKGSFGDLSDVQKELVMEVVANFHFRDGVHNPDGSMGTVKITNWQFNDCLAFMILQ